VEEMSVTVISESVAVISEGVYHAVVCDCEGGQACIVMQDQTDSFDVVMMVLPIGMWWCEA
jgi:hypothetical protein